MPDLPHLLAFLSASRYSLPEPGLAPGTSGTPRLCWLPGLPQTGGVQLNISEKVLSVVNKLYLETHGGWGLEQITAETPSGTAERHSSAPRNPAPHRVSWVEGPLSPEGYHPGPTLASLVEEKEKEDEDEDEDSYKDEEKGPDDVLTHHIQALARARSNYVGRQFQGLRARLTSNAGGPHSPGDPATELLQDVRHLLTDLQDRLSKDPDVRAVFGSRGPGVPQKEEDLGNKEDWEGIYGQCPDPYSTPRLPLAHVFPPMSTLVGVQQPGRAGGGGARRVEGQPALVFWGSDGGVCTPAIHLGARPAPPEPLGADAFLPALTEELIWSPHIGETQLDVEFLMELLDPDELRGEAGYYLTTWFGALHHIAHYQPDVGRAPQGLSSEARASLRQWHSRRTLHRQDRRDRGAQVQLPFEEPWARDTVPRDGL
uniref:Ras and Rab interactor like n=1 Tax=Panthera tigris altaica TaxID=74533 RepID=A0A8C9J950_PANTA